MDRRRTLPALVAAVVVVAAAIVAFTSQGNRGSIEGTETDHPVATSLPGEGSTPTLSAAPHARSRDVPDQRHHRGAEANPSDGPPTEDESVVGSATVAGVVVDEKGRPVEGAQVWAASLVGTAPTVEGWEVRGQRGARTGADGRFVVTGLAAGETLVSAEGPGSADDISRLLEDVRLKAPRGDLRLVLVHMGSARLRVLRPDGTAFVGTADWVDDGSLGSGAQVETKDGVFGRYGLKDGDYEFRVGVKGFAPIRRPFHARLGGVVDLGDAVLDPGVTLRGRVIDAANAPVPGARVIVDLIPIVTSDGRGAFTLEHVPRGAVAVTVQADGFLWGHAHLDAAEAAGDVTVTLFRGGVVYGILRDSAGKPAGSIDLSAIPLDANGERTEADAISGLTQDSGYMFWRLPAGRWLIVWQRPATDPVSAEAVTLAEWALVEGERKKIDLELPAR